jgi:hypothetical protein
MKGRLTQEHLAALKARNRCDALASQWVLLRKAGQKMVGPCPICSDNKKSKTAGRFEAETDRWVCAVCPTAEM